MELLGGSGGFGDGAAEQELCYCQKLQPLTGEGWAGAGLQGPQWPQGTKKRMRCWQVEEGWELVTGLRVMGWDKENPLL